MRPYNQEEADMTETALVLAPVSPQGYCCPIQQDKNRLMINRAITILNTMVGGIR